jgi:hypothetical protein
MRNLCLGSRKVQLIRGTFFISLPSFWAKNFGVQKGDEICIRLLESGSLEISKAHDAESDKVVGRLSMLNEQDGFLSRPDGASCSN